VDALDLLAGVAGVDRFQAAALGEDLLGVDHAKAKARVWRALTDPDELGWPRRSGRELLYRPTPEPMSEAMSWMSSVGARWDQRLARLSRQLAGG